MLNRSFWKGRRVFLTGHTGFKGSWLSLWLNALGANVTGYALDPPTQPSLFEQAEVAGAVKSICADIRDFPRLKVCDSRVPSRRGHSHGCAVRRASRLRGSHRNLLLQRHGDRSSPGGAAAARTAVRRGQRHERQVLREQRVGLGISGERADGRTGSIFKLARLRRARDLGVSRVVLPPQSFGSVTASPSRVLAPGTSSAAAIGPVTSSFPTS